MSSQFEFDKRQRSQEKHDNELRDGYNFGEVSIESASLPEINDETRLSDLVSGLPVQLVVRSDDDEALWNFFQENQAELESLIYETVKEASDDLGVLHVSFERGSLVIGLLLTSFWLVTNISGILAATNEVMGIVANYPKLKVGLQTVKKDLRTAVSRLQTKIRAFFGG